MCSAPGRGYYCFLYDSRCCPDLCGNKRWDEKAHPHESPALMWVPMAILAVGSVASGFIFSYGNSLRDWLSPVVEHKEVHESELLSPAVISLLALVLVLVGVGLAVQKYLRSEVPLEAPQNVSIFTKIARRDLLQDDFNEVVLMRPGQKLTSALVETDKYVIDGAVHGVARLAAGSGSLLRTTQTGFVRSYAMWILLGCCSNCPFNLGCDAMNLFIDFRFIAACRSCHSLTFTCCK